MEQKEIYILLTHTGSVLSRLIKYYTKEPYSHVSIAFDLELKEVYSFGRKRPNNPLIAGFVNEDIQNGTYAIFKDTTYALYSLKITDKQYVDLKNTIAEFKKKKCDSSYNLLGLFGIMFGFPINKENSYFCSQFVATTFERSGIRIFNKPAALITPKDFRLCKDLEFINCGKLLDYKICTSSKDIIFNSSLLGYKDIPLN